MRYQDRAPEELRVLIANYINKAQREGIRIDPEIMAEKLKDMAEEKERRMFTQTFEQLTPNSLRDAANILIDLITEPEMEKAE